MFFDLCGLTADALARAGARLEVYLYLRRAAPDLEQHVSADTFRLGCAPVVNTLFPTPLPLSLMMLMFTPPTAPASLGNSAPRGAGG